MPKPGKKVKNENGVPIGYYDDEGRPHYYGEEEDPDALKNLFIVEDNEEHPTHAETQAEEREARYEESKQEGYPFVPELDSDDEADEDDDSGVDESVPVDTSLPPSLLAAVDDAN